MTTYVGYDSETALFGPSRMAPPLACLSVTTPQSDGLYGSENAPAVAHALMDGAKAGRYRLVGANNAYDNGVLMALDPSLTRPVFEAYQANGIEDIQIRELLIDIAKGIVTPKGTFVFNHATQKNEEKGYKLGELSERLLDRPLDKTLQKAYGPLVGTCPSTWAPEYRHYPLEDSRATRDIAVHQEEQVRHDPEILHDSHAQARAAFALHLTSCWGMRVDEEAVNTLRVVLTNEITSITKNLQHHGFVRADGSRDKKLLQRYVHSILGDRAPLTKGGKTRGPQVSVAGEVLEGMSDPLMVDMVRYTEIKDIIFARYLNYLSQTNGHPVQTGFYPLLVTGRCSSREPNIQQFPRDAAVACHASPPCGNCAACLVEITSVREVFIPRNGNVFVGCDYDTLELRTLAQACLAVLGKSRLAEALRAGLDPHLQLAAILVGVDYPEALRRYKAGDKLIADMRQMSKPANFGFPAGMGTDTFVDYAWRSYGVRVDEATAQKLKDAFMYSWTEIREYWSFIQALVGPGGGGEVVHLYSRRRRGRCHFTAAANSFFQGMAADGAKAALFEVVRRTFCEPYSALWGCKVVNFLHDEILLEAPEHRAHEAAIELQAVMCEEMSKFVQDVPVKATPVLMRRWIKGAKPVYDAGGRLIPYERKRAA